MLLFCFVLLFRATPVAYVRSQARGPFGPAAANLHHISRQHWNFNPLIKAGDWTHVLMDTSWVHYPWAMIWEHFFKKK